MRLLLTSMTGHLPFKLDGDASCHVRHCQLLQAHPPPLIDDFKLLPATTSPSTNERYTHHSPICYCRLPAVLITMLFVMSLFVLFNLTSILALHMLVPENVMIYVLVLISKLPIFATDWLWYSTRSALASFSGNVNFIKTVNIRGLKMPFCWPRETIFF